MSVLCLFGATEHHCYAELCGFLFVFCGEEGEGKGVFELVFKKENTPTVADNAPIILVLYK